MITGHFGVAFLARGVRRDALLPLLLVAAILPDIVDLVFAAMRFCSPAGAYSHSFPVLAPLAILAFAVGRAVSKTVGAGLAMAAVVLLHLAGDFLTGEKFLWPDGPIVGLRLYQWPIVDFLIEVPLVIGGWVLLRRTPGAPRWATSAITLAALIALQGAFDIAKSLGEKGKPSGCLAGTVIPRSP